MVLCCLTACGALCDARGGRTMKDGVCEALRLHLSVRQSAYLQWREAGRRVKRASDGTPREGKLGLTQAAQFPTYLSHVGENSTFRLKCRQGVNRCVYF